MRDSVASRLVGAIFMAAITFGAFVGSLITVACYAGDWWFPFLMGVLMFCILVASGWIGMVLRRWAEDP